MKINFSLAAALAISAFVAVAGVSLPALAAGTPADNAECFGNRNCGNFINACHLGGGTLVPSNIVNGIPQSYKCVFEDEHGHLMLDLKNGGDPKPGRATFQQKVTR